MIKKSLFKIFQILNKSFNLQYYSKFYGYKLSGASSSIYMYTSWASGHAKARPRNTVYVIYYTKINKNLIIVVNQNNQVKIWIHRKNDVYGNIKCMEIWKHFIEFHNIL